MAACRSMSPVGSLYTEKINMAKLEVVAYSMKWNPVHNKGEVQTIFSDGQVVKLPVDSDCELSAILIMLSKKPVFFDTDTLFLECPQRATGS